MRLSSVEDNRKLSEGIYTRDVVLISNTLYVPGFVCLYGYTATAMQEIEYISPIEYPPPPPVSPLLRLYVPTREQMERNTALSQLNFTKSEKAGTSYRLLPKRIPILSSSEVYLVFDTSYLVIDIG